MKFAQNLKFLRLKNKLSQRELSIYLKIPQTTLSDLENGKYEPDLSVAKKIANYFGKTIDEMI